MRGHYLLAVGDARSKLQSGMREWLSGSNFALFGSSDLEACRFADSAFLIGELFDSDGNAVDATSLSQGMAPQELRDRVLRHCWGNYLLVQSETDGLTATLSPAVAGNVPCVYRVSNGHGFLTSDVSLAVAAGLYAKRVDWEAIGHRLVFPSIKRAGTSLAGLCELLPGTTLRVEHSRASVADAWSPWTWVTSGNRYATPAEASESVRKAIDCAVRAMATKDGTTLLELSGGLDSSIVAAALSDTSCQVSCANLITPVPGVDERRYAAQMADVLGVPLHIEPLPFERSRLEFPVSSGSVSPGMGPLQNAIDEIMEAAAHRLGTRSYFSGGGGDSVFCYLRTAAPAADALQLLGLRRGLAAVGDLAALHQCTFWKATHLTLRKRLCAPNLVPRPVTTFIAGSLGEMQAAQHPWGFAPVGALHGDRERIIDLAGNQLFQGQAARAATRPFRFPLLSQPVVEACLRAPSWLWIDGGRNRAVARAAYRTALPAEVFQRQSKATYIGYLGAVYQQRKHEMREFLLGGRLADEGLLDPSAIAAYIAAPLPARDQTFLRLFELCMVENWVRQQP